MQVTDFKTEIDDVTSLNLVDKVRLFTSQSISFKQHCCQCLGFALHSLFTCFFRLGNSFGLCLSLPV